MVETGHKRHIIILPHRCAASVYPMCHIPVLILDNHKVDSKVRVPTQIFLKKNVLKIQQRRRCYSTERVRVECTAVQCLAGARVCRVVSTFSSYSTTTLPAEWLCSGAASSSPLLSAGYTVNNVMVLHVWKNRKTIYTSSSTEEATTVHTLQNYFSKLYTFLHKKVKSAAIFRINKVPTFRNSKWLLRQRQKTIGNYFLPGTVAQGIAISSRPLSIGVK